MECNYDPSCVEKCAGPEAGISGCADTSEALGKCAERYCPKGIAEDYTCMCYRCGLGEMFPKSGALMCKGPAGRNEVKIEALKACQTERCAAVPEGDFNTCMCKKCKLAEIFPNWGVVACRAELAGGDAADGDHVVPA